MATNGKTKVLQLNSQGCISAQRLCKSMTAQWWVKNLHVDLSWEASNGGHMDRQKH